MTVDKYIFQSPYSSQVQVGRPAPSAGSDSGSSSVNQEAANNTQSAPREIPSFESMDTQKATEVTPTENSDTLLNLYA
ncbi:MAG: hypothetical protein DRG78_23365 [Epsilonproteobacteria bacterium]|nr:MAG: hypothetical protein DRG78_23365 [Campylobacterota bacterium]